MKDKLKYKVPAFTATMIALIFISSIFALYSTGYFSQQLTVKNTDQGTVALIVEGNTVEEDSVSESAAVEPSKGGSIVTPQVGRDEFSVIPEFLKTISKAGDRSRVPLVIKNNNKDSIFSISENIDWIYLSEDSFSLASRSEKTLYVSFLAPEGTRPDAYTGSLIISNGNIEKNIPVIYEVQPEKLYFDLDLDVLPEFKTTMPGGNLSFEVSLFALDPTKEISVDYEYMIKDMSNNVLYSYNDNATFIERVSIIKSITIPKDLGDGQYILVVKIIYEDSVHISSDIFAVESQAIDTNYILAVAAILILSSAAVFVFYELNRRKLKNIIRLQNSQIAEIKRGMARGMKQSEARYGLNKLKALDILLDKSYKTGYIKLNAYVQSKKKISMVERDIRRRYL